MFDKLIDILVTGWHRLCPVFIVAEYERGVVLRSGIHHRDLEPGLRLRWPLIETHLIEMVVDDMETLPPQALTTSDGVAVITQWRLEFRIGNVRKLLLNTVDRKKAITEVAQGMVAKHVRNAVWDALVGEPFREACYKELRSKCFKYGVEIFDLEAASLQRAKTYLLLHKTPPPEIDG